MTDKLYEDVKEIKKDVKTLLAWMNFVKGCEKTNTNIAAIIAFCVSTIISILALMLRV